MLRSLAERILSELSEMNDRPLPGSPQWRLNDRYEGVNGPAPSRFERSETPIERSKAAGPSSARLDNVGNFQARDGPEVGLAIKSADKQQDVPRELDDLAVAASRPARR